MSCSRCGKCCMDEPIEEDWGVGDPDDWHLDNGWCKYLKDNGDGTFSCTIYDQRPQGCREFPKTEEEKYPGCTFQIA